MRLQTTHLLAIDLDEAVDDELPRLADTAGEQSAEDGRVKTPLQREVGHLHVRRHGRSARLLQAVGAHAAARSLLGAVVAGEVAVVHGDDGGQVAAEHVLPLLLADVLAVVGAGARLGGPFLLEVGAGGDVGGSELGEGVQGPARPVLADVLRASAGGGGSRGQSRGRTSFFSEWNLGFLRGMAAVQALCRRGWEPLLAVQQFSYNTRRARAASAGLQNPARDSSTPSRPRRLCTTTPPLRLHSRRPPSSLTTPLRPRPC